MLTESYQIRPYEPSDREQFLSLYESVWGRRKERDWFTWRFERNPYRDGVQMVVAERGDELVGAEPLLPFRLRLGSTVLDTYQPVDWIVHADHRRRGLFTRMTESLLDRYADDAALLFNFPNDVLLPGLRKFGWEAVGPVPMSYRIQNPRRFLSEHVSRDTAAVTDSLPAIAGTATERVFSALDRINSPPPEFTIETRDRVPEGTLTSLYSSARPRRIHVARDDAFYRWRFANPRWDVKTYLASRGGRLVAGVVTATERVDDCSVTQLLDYQPMRPENRRVDAFEALLYDVVMDHRDSDLLKAPATFYPRLLRRYGFFDDDGFPLKRLTSTSTHAVRVLGDEWAGGGSGPGRSRTAFGQALFDPDNWLLSLVDVDIE